MSSSPFTLELCLVASLENVLWGLVIRCPFFISEGLDATGPASLLTLQSVICATSDIDIWLLAAVKDIGVVIFVFILTTSLEGLFATGEITNEYQDEPGGTRWSERSFWCTFLYCPGLSQQP